MRVRELVFTANPQQLSDELRQSADPFMHRRRRIVGLSLLSAACMGLIAAYQIGLIRRLPEPPIAPLDAEEVDAAPEAYALLSTGDAFLGLVSYSVTMLLAGVGTPTRYRQVPWLPMALAAKAAFDAAQAAKLSVDQWVKHRAFCSWCLTAAAATFAVVPQTLPELGAAIRAVRDARVQKPDTAPAA